LPGFLKREALHN